MKTITGIKARKGRLDVFLDGAFAFSVSPAIAKQARLAPMQALSDSHEEALKQADLLQRSYDAALRYLSYRPRTETEVRTRLRRGGLDAALVDKVIAGLKLQGLVDDAAFASFWRENRLSFSPRSSRLIGVELQRKGVARELIATTLSETDDDSAAYEAGQKKARSLAGVDRQEFRRKLGSFLIRRGFSYEVCGHTVERLWQERADSQQDLS